MSRRFFMLVGLMLAVILAACGPASQVAPTQAPTDSSEQPTVAAAAPAPTEAPAATADPAPAQQPEQQAAQPGGRLQTIKDRGNLICGVNGGLPGFGNLEADGSFKGFDVDVCRVVAAAILGDANAVEFRPLSAQERFTALQTGQVDMLSRNTTYTTSRDSSVGLDFGPTTFYDGQGLMVHAEVGATTLEDLNGATVCVQSGTTTELNLTDQFRSRGIEFTPVVFEEIDPTYQAYEEGRCDAVTSDRSQLIARRTVTADPNAHTILDVTISKEPLGPAIAQGESALLDVVEWAVFATIQAEEFGIDSTNLDSFLNSENPDVRRFLGVDGELGAGLGLSNDFTQKIITQVGNYAEIYNRHLGPETPFNLDRGLNKQWTEGGLLYSPPFR